MLRFLKYFSFSFSGCKSVVGCWVCLSMASDCYLEGSIYFLFRKENVAFQEDLILNHKELFGVNTLLGQKGCLGFLDSCSVIVSWTPFPLSPCLHSNA